MRPVRAVKGVKQSEVTLCADLEDGADSVGAAIKRGPVEIAVGSLHELAKRIDTIRAAEGVEHAECALGRDLVNGAIRIEWDAFVSGGKTSTTTGISVEVALDALDWRRTGIRAIGPVSEIIERGYGAPGRYLEDGTETEAAALGGRAVEISTERQRQTG